MEKEPAASLYVYGGGIHVFDGGPGIFRSVRVQASILLVPNHTIHSWNRS